MENHSYTQYAVLHQLTGEITVKPDGHSFSSALAALAEVTRFNKQDSCEECGFNTNGHAVAFRTVTAWQMTS